MSNIESGGGGASEEETAEAEKFNEMVDEGKLTPADMKEMEKDKTPEEVEAEKVAMEKVMNINQEGTAYSTPRFKVYGERAQLAFRNILTEGFLGNPWPWSEETQRHEEFEKEGSVKKHWAESVRRTRRNLVYCNVVGRDIEDISQASWEFPGVIFDLSKFKEDMPLELGNAYEHWESIKFKQRTFMAYDDGGSLVPDDEQGRPKPHPSSGFAVSSRVAPEFFRGIVIDGKMEQEEINKKTSEYIQLMKDVYREKPKLFLPIYDQQGNLLWPRKITYDQVKQFVAERESKKKAEEK